MTFHDVRMRGFKRRADVDEVLAWIDARPVAPPNEKVPLAEAGGRVLSAPIWSTVDVPAFRRAAMDGWALRGTDTFGAGETDPLALTVIGTALPGRPFDGRVGRGQAVRIMPGAPVPPGADTVLRAEDGTQDGKHLEVRAPVAVGRHVGEVGEDIRAETRVLPPRRVLRPQDLGVLSSIGHTGALDVVAPVHVAILVTGDEVDPPGTPPSTARIADANGPMLRALVARDGGHATITYLPDDAEQLAERMVGLRDRRDGSAAHQRSSLLLVTGGSSVGDEDHAPRLLHELGELAFHGIGLRPAAPTGIGALGGTPAFLLPGNPVSCLCAYDLFAGRMLRRMAGRPAAMPYPTARGVLVRKLSSVLGRVDYVRVRLRDGRVDPVMASGASILSSTTEADGFVLVPRDHEGWAEGAEVEVHCYDAVPSARGLDHEPA
jgi:molybdopterin molybdotransferase